MSDGSLQLVKTITEANGTAKQSSIGASNQVTTTETITKPTGLDRNGIPLVWMHLEEEFEPAGDLVQTFNVDHNGMPRVTISWFHARSGGMTSADPGPCFMHVTTASDGERITTQGAKRTWQWVGNGSPTTKDVQALVTAWKVVLEHEVRGTCPNYTITWQEANIAVSAAANPAAEPAKNAPSAAQPTITKGEWKTTDADKHDNPNAAKGQPSVEKVNLSANQVAVVWWNARLSNEAARAPREFLVLTKSIEVTYEGAYRLFTWTGSNTPTIEQITDLAKYFAGVLASDGSKWTFRIVQ